jgi:hypothetical protein
MSLDSNLDHAAAVAAQTILTGIGEKKWGDAETLIRKCLGVLQENGVFAAVLYLSTRKDKKEAEPAEAISCQLIALAEKVAAPSPRPPKAGPAPGNPKLARLEYLTRDVTCNIHTLLLVKSLWEQALIYARYGAKL